MITINLLPEELKRREGTPLRRLALTLAGALLTTSAVSVYAYTEFGLMPGIQSEREQVQSVLTSLASAAGHSDGLAREKQDYDRRIETIQKIGNSRVLWSRKLDQFFDIVNNDADRDSHFIWLKTVSAKPGLTTGKEPTGGALSISGYSATSKLQRLSQFHEDIKNHEFFGDFFFIDNPSGKVVEWDDGRKPEAAWEFSFNLKLSPPGEDKEKEAPKASGNTRAESKG
jgi:Tfp pilus assembly protein PilN